MRTIVAVLPIAAKAKILATSNLVLSFICKSQKMKKGSVPRIQSAAALTAARAYVMPFVGPADRHLSDAG